MSGPQSKEDRKRRKLISDEDRALWNHVASSLEPARGKSRVRAVENVPDVAPSHDAKRQPYENGARHKSSAPAKSTPPPPPLPRPKSTAKPEPQQATLDRRKARRIARGSHEIEARLDLHGMTQDDAHAALVGFVRRCHAQGFGTVLIITGKGGRAHSDAEEVVPRRPGILRRNVPRWLAGAEIGALVVSYATAHIRHGGEGALYVQLRRKR